MKYEPIFFYYLIKLVCVLLNTPYFVYAVTLTAALYTAATELVDNPW
jgi:hypothetical protein